MLTSANKMILRLKQLHYHQLSSSSLEILPNIIRDNVSNFESKYLTFLDQAHPLTTQMHQLQLLPGIGQKRMWAILEGRKNGSFRSFADFIKKTGISDPISLFSNRILMELEGASKYFLFTKKPIKHD